MHNDNECVSVLYLFMKRYDNPFGFSAKRVYAFAIHAATLYLYKWKVATVRYKLFYSTKSEKNSKHCFCIECEVQMVLSTHLALSSHITIILCRP